MAEKALNPEDMATWANMAASNGVILSRATGRAVRRYRHYRRPKVRRPFITCFKMISTGQTCGPVEVPVENKWKTCW